MANETIINNQSTLKHLEGLQIPTQPIHQHP